MMGARAYSVLAFVAIGSIAACDDKPAPQAAKPAPPAPAPAASVAEAPKEPEPANPLVDPLKGKFTLEDATKDLPGSGTLLADLDTVSGKITCELYEDKAPLTVANFVGLARGIRPWRNAEQKWVTQPLFDGNEFHRLIGRFMIQGGSPSPSGNAGYFFADEPWEGATHDRAGLLCMANSGPDTNSAQFFILDGEAKYLDKRGHTIFGICKPLNVIHKIATAKTGPKDRPTTPQTIKKVTIRRAKAK
jgi:peptidyl-prolyl cis-trans isomerase A (cyclophilin A)